MGHFIKITIAWQIEVFKNELIIGFYHTKSLRYPDLIKNCLRNKIWTLMLKPEQNELRWNIAPLPTRTGNWKYLIFENSLQEFQSISLWSGAAPAALPPSISFTSHPDPFRHIPLRPFSFIAICLNLSLDAPKKFHPESCCLSSRGSLARTAAIEKSTETYK